MDDISAVPDPAPGDPDRLLSVTEMAQKLRIGRNTLARRINAREVPHLRIGRRALFTPQHVQEIMAMYEVRPLIRPQRRARAS